MKLASFAAPVLCLLMLSACQSPQSGKSAAPAPGPATGLPGDNTTAEARAITGAPEASTDRINWTRVKIGDVLAAGTSLRTSGDASMELFLGVQHPFLRLAENSLMTLEEMRGAGSADGAPSLSRLRLYQGTLLANWPNPGPHSRCEVVTQRGKFALTAGSYLIPADGKAIKR